MVISVGLTFTINSLFIISCSARRRPAAVGLKLVTEAAFWDEVAANPRTMSDTATVGTERLPEKRPDRQIRAPETPEMSESEK